MPSFTVNRSLLNHAFEGYKLSPVSHSHMVTRHALRYKPTQSIASGRYILSAKEMQSRIIHNHLAVAEDRTHALYVDAERRVVLVDVEPVRTRLSPMLFPLTCQHGRGHSNHPSGCCVSCLGLCSRLLLAIAIQNTPLLCFSLPLLF